MTDIPVIETERLRLRPHVRDDFEQCCALWGSPHTVRFIGGQVQDRQTVWFRLLRYAGSWAMLGYGYWAFEEKATRRFIGEGGLTYACRGIDALEDVPEPGWVLTPDAGGKGYATEAVQAIMAFADNVLKAPVTRCIIEPDNLPSLGVARKCGFSEVTRTQRGETTLIVLERTSAA